MKDFLYKNIPDYYKTMYLDGYTPEQILVAARKTFYQEYIDSKDSAELDRLHITSEVKIK